MVPEFVLPVALLAGVIDNDVFLLLFHVVELTADLGANVCEAVDVTVLDFPCLEFAVTEVTDLEVFVILGPDVVDLVERLEVKIGSVNI